MPSNYEVTDLKDEFSAQRFIFRVTPLDDGGETIGGATEEQLTVEGIDGSPEGRSVGSIGDLRIRKDVGQLWIKVLGIGTKTGWSRLTGTTDSETWAETLANGAVSGGTDPVISDGDILKIGEGGDSPSAVMLKSETGTSAISMQRTLAPQANDKRIVNNADESFSIEHHNGASWDEVILVDNNSDAIFGASTDVSMIKPDLLLALGDGTSNVTQRFYKSDAGDSFLEFYQSAALGAGSWRFQHRGSDETFILSRYDGVGWDPIWNAGANFLGIIVDNVLIANGDAGGAASVTIRKPSASTGSLNFYSNTSLAANAKRISHNADETLTIDNYNGASWDEIVSFENSLAAIFAGNIALNSSSAVLQIGNAAGSPLQQFRKLTTGTSSIQFLAGVAAATNDKRIIHNADESLSVSHYNGSSWDEILQFQNTLASVFTGAISVNVSAAVVNIGDGTGPPTTSLRKGAASASVFNFYVGTSESANDKRIVHNTDETFTLENYNGSSWDVGFKLSNAAHASLKNGTGALGQAAEADTDLAVNNTASQTSVGSYTVPALEMGANGSVRFVLSGEYLNNSGANRNLTVDIVFGVTTIVSFTISTIPAGPDLRAFRIEGEIVNRNNQAVQIANVRMTLSGPTAATTGIGDLTTFADGVISSATAGEDTSTGAVVLDLLVTHSAADPNLTFTRKYVIFDVVHRD